MKEPKFPNDHSKVPSKEFIDSLPPFSNEIAASAQRMVKGLRLRKAREMAGLSQAQAAKMLDIPSFLLDAIECGEGKLLTDERIENFVTLYQVDRDWLLGAGMTITEVVERHPEIKKLGTADFNAVADIILSIGKK